jgi:hypothetical protein
MRCKGNLPNAAHFAVDYRLHKAQKISCINFLLIYNAFTSKTREVNECRAYIVILVEIVENEAGGVY